MASRAHATHYVNVVAAFPDKCRYVLETFQQVFHHDELARRLALDPKQRLYHQQHSKPLMDKLENWCKQQFDERMVEPNSGLGKQFSICSITGRH